jgi:hypothetical protein
LKYERYQLEWDSSAKEFLEIFFLVDGKGALHQRKKRKWKKIVFNNGSKNCVKPLHSDLSPFWFHK